MPRDLKGDIQRYSQLFGPSGEEDLVIRAVVDDLQAAGFEAQIDVFGNVSAMVTDAAPGHPTVMVSAHTDEIGFVVRKIDENGFLRLHRVGGVHDRVMAGQRLLFRTARGVIEGSVGVKAKHVSSPDELSRAVRVDEAYVDVCARSAEEAADLGLEVGTLGTFKGDFTEQNGFVRAKALDDRVGIALLLDLARRVHENPPKAGVVVLATVQEEFSVRGGIPAARVLQPDLAFCLDIAIATDTPDLRDHGDVRLGEGPVVTRFTRANLNGIIPNPKLRRFATETANTYQIPIQYGVLQGGLTDGSYMQYEGKGIPTLDVSFPTRYTHTPVETCHLEDISLTSDLVLAMLHDMPAHFDLSRG
ncbi:MAG TPA: hypothetical protein VF171_01185 [Trueperaceae bacterium]